jgi:hypothetical protein
MAIELDENFGWPTYMDMTQRDNIVCHGMVLFCLDLFFDLGACFWTLTGEPRS